MQYNLFKKNEFGEFLFRYFVIANSSSKGIIRQRFYEIKKIILIDHGIFDDYDLQTITYPCWSCTNGVFEHFDGNKSTCFRCGGDGIYHIRQFYLKRYLLNGSIFHKPAYHEPKDCVIRGKIEGRILKNSVDEKGNYAALILFLFFKREYFWKSIKEVYVVPKIEKFKQDMSEALDEFEKNPMLNENKNDDLPI